MALGLGRGALDMAVRYANERQAFGRTIGQFDAMRGLLATSRFELDAAAVLVYRAAVLADSGRPYAREASMAKLYASEAATRACNASLQVHGGYGYTREFAVERHLRDVKICEIGEGTSQVQRMVIAKSVLASP
jgi:alkylation response protein AidB-like acyl-CoA dehydrogenase